MKNRGFTLVELLAVLTVLALIALIIVPIVSSSVNRASTQSQERSVEFYADAVEQAVLNYRIANGRKIYGTFTSSSDGRTLTNENSLTLTVDYKGNMKCDYVIVDRDGIASILGCVSSGSTTKFSYSRDTGIIQTNYNDCFVLSGDVSTAGSKIVCGEEQFYVVSSDTNTVTMLTVNGIELAQVAPKQTETPTNSKFSYTAYWSDSVNSYPADVYNENSLIYKYLDKYQNYLVNSGVLSAQVTMPNLQMLTSLGCEAPTSVSSSCEFPSWAQGVLPYWTGIATSASQNNCMCAVDSSGLTCGSPVFGAGFIIRPLVTINKTEIK